MERRKRPRHRLIFLHDQLAKYDDTCRMGFYLLFDLKVEVFVFILGINRKYKKVTCEIP